MISTDGKKWRLRLLKKGEMIPWLTFTTEEY